MRQAILARLPPPIKLLLRRALETEDLNKAVELFLAARLIFTAQKYGLNNSAYLG